MQENLQPHQQRIVDEKKELDVKIAALKKFIEEEGTIYLQLSKFEKGDLGQQLWAMEKYSACLKSRITRFNIIKSQVLE